MPPLHNFTEETGINSEEVDRSKLMTAADFFRLFFTIEFITELVHATNLYAANVRSNSEYQAEWTPVDEALMRVFLCLCMLMGMIDKPRIKDNWSQTLEIATPFFSWMMKRD